jgi:hypothetical protein
VDAVSKIGWSKYLVLAACGALALVGCGDDDEKSPRAKCETVARTYCDRAVECFEEADLFNNASEAREAQDECEADFASSDGADCNNAVRVTDRYSECLSDLPRMSCNAIVNDQEHTPASCANVILTDI